MGGLQAVGKLAGNIQGIADLQRTLGDSVLQIVALDVGHRNEGLTLDLINLIHRANVRMVDRRRRPGFPDQAGSSLLVSQQSPERNFNATARPSTVSSAR